MLIPYFFISQLAPPIQVIEDEVQTVQPVNVDRRILLTEDAKYRFKLRQLRKKSTLPLAEDQVEMTPSQELAQPSNFKNLPDNTQIIRGTSAGIADGKGLEILPFSAIIAIVTSYKYSINTWTPGIVNFIVDTGNKLYGNKQEKFQLAPAHIIPKIAIGHQVKHYAIICIPNQSNMRRQHTTCSSLEEKILFYEVPD